LNLFGGYARSLIDFIELNNSNILFWSNNFKFYIYNLKLETLIESTKHNSQIFGIERRDNKIVSWSNNGEIYQWTLKAECINKYIILSDQKTRFDDWISTTTFITTIGNKVTPYTLMLNNLVQAI